MDPAEIRCALIESSRDSTVINMFRIFKILLFYPVTGCFSKEGAPFYAYDCEDPIGKPTMFSLVDSGECPLMQTTFEPGMPHPILVVQAADLVDTTLTHCDVTYSSTITRCGYNSLTYGSTRPDDGTRLVMSADECRKAYEQGEFIFYGVKIRMNKEKVGSTSIWLHGNSDLNGDCETESFSWKGQRYVKSYMQVQLKFRITQSQTQTTLSSDVIKLPGNVVCRKSDQSCQDGIEGTFMWKIQDDECREKFQRVYLGSADVYTSRDQSDESEIVIISDKHANRFAGFMSSGEVTICGHRLRKTQSEHLYYILDINLSDPPRIGHDKMTDIRQDVFLATSVGYSSFSTQLSAEASVTSIQREVCNIYRKQLKDKLVFIRHHPDGSFLEDWGFNKTRLDLAGSAMSAAQCRKVSVKIRSNSFCTQEIPVYHKDQPRFVDATSFQLKRNFTRTICSNVAPIMWKIGSRWWCSLPAIIECAEPRILDPTVSSIEKFGLTTDGIGLSIYTSSDMESYKERQIFNDNRGTIEASISYQQQYGDSNDTSWTSMVDGANFETVKERLRFEFYPHIAWMGDFGGMFVGVSFFIALMIFILQAGSRAFFIMKTEGFSWKLIGIAGETLMLLVMFPLELIKNIHRLGRDKIGNSGYKKTADDDSKSPIMEGKSRCDVEKPSFDISTMF